jgi:Domain of unknown function (DUF6321)
MRAHEFIQEEKVRLDAKCWKGKKIGNPKTKLKGGVRVNNCVPKESIDEDLNQQFDLIEKMVESIAEENEVDVDAVWESFDSVADEDLLSEAEAWQTSKGKNKNGGLNKKGVASYRRSHPGSKLQTAVTTKPSKLKKGSKASKRRKSFCARMRGMKKHRTGAKTKRDPNSRINKSLRKWNCESVEQLRNILTMLKETKIGHLSVGDMDIEVDSHSINQSISRFVSPRSVDKVLKKFPTVEDKISKIPDGHKFWVFDVTNDVAVGMRCLDAENKRYRLMTVVGSKPYNGPTPIITTS